MPRSARRSSTHPDVAAIILCQIPVDVGLKRSTWSGVLGSAQAHERNDLAAQAAKTAAEATETAAKEAEKAASENDALESTSKAAVAAWRASQVCSFCIMLSREEIPNA